MLKCTLCQTLLATTTTPTCLNSKQHNHVLTVNFKCDIQRRGDVNQGPCLLYASSAYYPICIHDNEVSANEWVVFPPIHWPLLCCHEYEEASERNYTVQ